MHIYAAVGRAFLFAAVMAYNTQIIAGPERPCKMNSQARNAISSVEKFIFLALWGQSRAASAPANQADGTARLLSRVIISTLSSSKGVETFGTPRDSYVLHLVFSLSLSLSLCLSLSTTFNCLSSNFLGAKQYIKRTEL